MPTKGNPKIRITEASYERLKAFKLDEGETNAETMARFIKSYDSLSESNIKTMEKTTK